MEDENGPNLDSFLEWAASLGITDSPHTDSRSCLGHTLSVSHFPHAGGRGLAAMRDIRRGELLLRVPKEALITTATLMSKDPTLASLVLKYPSLSSAQILAVSLLNEVNKGRNSCWYPYLKQLPRSYDLLASFGQFEIEALQIDDAIWTAEKAFQTCKNEWKEATWLMQELNLKSQLRTLAAWLWASATISSRTMHISWDNAGCLCPVGDFFNYAPPGENQSCSDDLENVIDASLSHVTFSDKRVRNGNERFDANLDRLIDAGYEEEIAAYCFYARTNYNTGDQVLLSYGTYTNLDLLEHYGFLLQANPNDKAFIPLEPEIYCFCSWPKESMYVSEDGRPSFSLLSTLRLWATPVSKRKLVGHIACSGNQISPENEVNVMECIAKKCAVSLKSYLTSIEEDELILNIIDKILDFNSSIEIREVPAAVAGEFAVFLKGNGIMDEKCAVSHISPRTRRSLYRWRLAVHWRHRHKKILSDCISHCSEMLKNFYTQNLPR